MNWLIPSVTTLILIVFIAAIVGIAQGEIREMYRLKDVTFARWMMIILWNVVGIAIITVFDYVLWAGKDVSWWVSLIFTVVFLVTFCWLYFGKYLKNVDGKISHIDYDLVQGKKRRST